MKSEFVLAINEIIETRALPREVVLDALSSALVSAYRRDVSASSAQRVEAEIDMNTGTATILVEKEVVESVENPRTEIAQDEARGIEPEAELGTTIMVPVTDTTRQFGRIAAQTAKQVILQKIREAEREALFEEYAEREGDLISGTVQSVTPQAVTLSLGRTEALLPRNQQMRGERYKPHDKVRTYVLKVERTNRGPQIIVSRSHRDMLRRLLEYEVPEIYNGQVEIKNIAREAGQRSKVAVAALQEGVDPVGACVGMRGIRIENIVRELSDEKIDVIEWNPDPATFITKALSPARVSGVFLDDEANAGRSGIGTATVLVPDDQLSLAIGREGQNARLAAKLTGWRIDIKSVTEAVAEALARKEAPEIVKLNETYPDLVTEVERILNKREAGRPVMPEEFQLLTRYASLAEDAWLESRKAERRQHQKRLQQARHSLPEAAFHLPLSVLGLPESVIEPLAELESVGELMARLEVEPDQIAQAWKDAPEEKLSQVGEAIQALDIEAALAELVAAEAEAMAEPEVVAEEAVEVAEPIAEPVEAATVEVVPSVVEAEVFDAALEADAEVLPAIVEPEPEPEVIAQPVQEQPGRPLVEPVEELEYTFEDFEEEGEERDLAGMSTQEKRKKGKAKQRRRQLVYDEELGEVVSRRKRKGSRRRDFWEDEVDI